MSPVYRTTRRSLVLFALATLAALAPAAGATRAQAQDSLGPEYLSSKACAVLVVRTGDILSSPDTELWPHEIIQALALQSLAIDSEHIAEIMLQIETPEMSGGGPPNPSLAAVIRLTEAYEIDQVLPMLQGDLGDGDINGQPARFASRHGQPSLYMPDELTLVVGGGPMLRRIGRLENPGTKLAEMVAALGNADNATLVVDLEALRPMILELREMVPANQLPPPLAGLLEAPELLDGLIASANITGDCQCRLILQATDEAAAGELSERVSAALDFYTSMTLAQSRQSMPEDDAISQAWIEYAERMVPQVMASLEPEVQGDQLVLEYKLGPIERLAIRFGMAGAVAGITQERALYGHGSERVYIGPVERGEHFDEFEEYGEEAYESEEAFEGFEDEGAFEEDTFEEEDSFESDLFE